jgi:hypothetical protein
MDTRAQVSHPIFSTLSFVAYLALLPLGVYTALATGDLSILGLWCGFTAFVLLFHAVTRSAEQKQATGDEQATLGDYNGGE